MAIKRRLIVSGSVQEVGFRFFIKRVTTRLKIKKGSVKNLDDIDKVEIYIECTEGQYEKFKEYLDSQKLKPEEKYKPTTLTKIDIENIEEEDENSDEFNPEGIKSPFEICYKDDPEDKVSERFERGYLTIQNMDTDINEQFKDWGDRFDIFGNAVINLDKKLGSIDEKLSNLDMNIGRMTDFFLEHADFFVRNKKGKEIEKKEEDEKE